MKIWQTLLKNFRLLFRSKETAFTIIFGPLLIILLVGFAFSGDDELAITIGVYAPDVTPLVDDFVQHLQVTHTVDILASAHECTQNVKIGINQLCITFPEEFIVETGRENVVTFNVDPSRINIVYQIIDELSARFAVQKQELSIDLTGNILANLQVTKTILKNQTQNAKDAQTLRGQIASSLEKTDGKVTAEDINFSFVDLRLLRGQATSLEQDARLLHESSTEELDRAIGILNSLRSQCDTCENATKDLIEATLDDFEETIQELNGIYEDTPEKLVVVSRMIDDAVNNIDRIEGDYSSVQQDTTFVSGQLLSAQQSLGEMKGFLRDLAANLQYAHDLLDGVAIADSQTIVNPIRTEINELTGEEKSLTFTYPYILMLVIMFMGLMLGSTLIVTDKNSRAAFRNFTTATRGNFHVFMSFITTLMILLAQVSLIIVFSVFLIGSTLFANFGTTTIILLLAIILFSFLGMTIGYLASSQEAATITTLTIGSVMLFVSNLVIPIEGMNAFVRVLTYINPYVMLSEVLKKSMLFNVGIGQFGGQLILIILLEFVLLALVVWIQQYMRKKYFSQQATIELKKTAVKAHKPLVLDGKTIANEAELLTVLDAMTRVEFAQLITESNNPIYQWVSFQLENKSLARKLKKPNKEYMILVLDKHLRKQTKRATKKY